MPLMKSRSKAAFGHNVKAEMDAGKPMKQSLAIAYATKRRAKMAKGGMVLDQDQEQEDMQDPRNAKLTHDMVSPWQDDEPENESDHESPDIDQMPRDDDESKEPYPDMDTMIKQIRRKRMMR